MTETCLKKYSAPTTLYIIKTIKEIQKRMKDPDIVNLEYIRVYDTLGSEFIEFFETYTKIFTIVIKGEDLKPLAEILYYTNKVYIGEITEAELSEKLSTKFLPANLKKESDAKILEMRRDGKI